MDDQQNSRPVLRAPDFSDIKEEVKQIIEESRNEYAKTGDPHALLLAFMDAYEWGLPIPPWVGDALHDAFDRCLRYGDSLDRLLKLTAGRGETSPYAAIRLKHRDSKLISAVDVLVREGVRVTDAARIAVESVRYLSPPNPEKVRQLYYKRKRQNDGKPIPHFDSVEELLRKAPVEIRKKYRHLFEKYRSLWDVLRQDWQNGS